MSYRQCFVSIIIMVFAILPLNGCGQANATIIKDGQIVLFKRGNAYALIVPVEQGKNQKGYFMRFKYSNSVDSMEDLKNINIEHLPEDTIYDDGKVIIDNISASWTFRTNGAGYLYYGEIFGNYSIPVEMCVTDAQKIEDIDFSLSKYRFLRGEDNKNKKFRP